MVTRKNFLISNVSLFNSITGEVESNKTVVIKNGLINWVGEESAYDLDPSLEKIDGNSKYLFPGFIDCHVHLEYEDMTKFAEYYMEHSSHEVAYIAMKNAQEYLKSGFTTLRDCGSSSTNWGSSLRRTFQKKIFPSPRLLVSNEQLRQFGQEENIGPLELAGIFRKRNEVISGPEGVRHAVRGRKYDGADFIKTLTTGAVTGGQGANINQSFWTDEELSVMVEEAKRLGMHVAAHAHADEGIIRAVQADVRTIEHCSLPEESTMHEMAKRGTYLIPTQSVTLFFRDPSKRNLMRPDIMERSDMIMDKMVENHRIAFEKGVKFALGTDTPGGAPHCRSSVEMELMVQNVGMSNSEALQFATINAAEAIDMKNQLGSIEQGKIADLLLLDSNPAENLEILRDVNNFSFVIKEGEIVSKQGQIGVQKLNSTN